MKIRIVLSILFTSLILLSCSRDEPAITQAPVPPPAAESKVVMNEIYSRGTVDNLDWIELYNSGTTPVDIGGYKIYDSGGNTNPEKKMVIAAGTSIPAKGFFVIVTDIDKSLNGFGLSSSGEEVWLEDKTGKVIDNLVFPSMETNQSYSRIPDGGTWAITNTITRGASNK